MIWYFLGGILELRAYLARSRASRVIQTASGTFGVDQIREQRQQSPYLRHQQIVERPTDRLTRLHAPKAQGPTIAPFEKGRAS